MGKKKNKTKKKQNNSSNVNNNNNTNSADIIKTNDDTKIQSNNIKEIAQTQKLIDLFSIDEILRIINSKNLTEIKNLSSFLSNYNYDSFFTENKDNNSENDKKIFMLCSNDFLIPYISLFIKLSDINIATLNAIRSNIISSIISIFTTFSENSKYEINYKYIYNKILSNVFYQYFSSEKKDNKIICMLFDLFQLFIDLIKDKENINNKKDIINYDLIIKSLIENFINNNEDILIKTRSEFLLFSLVSNFYIEINKNNNLKSFIENIIKDINNSSPLLIFICFYTKIINKDLNSFDSILNKINSLSKGINIFNKNISELSHLLDNVLSNKEDKINIDDENNNDNIINDNTNNITDKYIEDKVNNFVNDSKVLFSLIKIYSDIIENLNDSNDNILSYDDDIFLNNMTISINKIFFFGENNKKNQININTFIEQNFVSLLIHILNSILSYNIEPYFINKNNSLFITKEYLNEINLLILGILDNYITKLDQKIPNDTLSLLLNYINSKITNYKIINEEEISLIILLYRNILEKKIIQNFNNSDIDYKILFTIYNFYLDNDYIKMNIIDIVAFLYSIEKVGDNKWYTMNKEINSLLLTLLYNEKEIEIISHVINAYMDIYQWDDAALNKILKESNVLSIMNNGSKIFKQKMENMFKNKDITEDTYDYISDTLNNMKRFIKYKENI